MMHIDSNEKIKLIQDTFDDKRKMTEIKNDEIGPGDIFKTRNGEIIYFDIEMNDFNEEELSRHSVIAEELYEKYQKPVYIYIICPSTIDVGIKECEIKSQAEFTIKLACINQDPCHHILNFIKEKIKNNEELNGDDLHALSMTPVMCKKEEREYFRQEYFKIVNQL